MNKGDPSQAQLAGVADSHEEGMFPLISAGWVLWCVIHATMTPNLLFSVGIYLTRACAVQMTTANI
eukprot:1159139-Pelagomonas_calceolata.AAC.11